MSKIKFRQSKNRVLNFPGYWDVEDKNDERIRKYFGRKKLNIFNDMQINNYQRKKNRIEMYGKDGKSWHAHEISKQLNMKVDQIKNTIAAGCEYYI